VVCGVWCVVCGVWCVVCGVWCVVCGVRCVVCGMWGHVAGFRTPVAVPRRLGGLLNTRKKVRFRAKREQCIGV